MTMIHIATKPISRSNGQSAVACASYRAGVELEDKRYGKTHDYSKKRGVMSADIVVPKSFKDLSIDVDRGELWNKCEEIENRKDARVAREWLINLPYQLDEKQRRELALDFAQKLVDKYNIIADVAIHKPVLKKPYDHNAKPSSDMLRENEENPDPRNFHAHILVTTREAKLDKNNNLTFSETKIPLEWSNKKRFKNDMISSADEIKEIRQLFADCANEKLLANNLSPMDARSYKERGLDKLPTIKLGADANALERKGIRTEKGDMNRRIIEMNQLMQLHKEITSRLERDNDRIEQSIREANQLIEESSQTIEQSNQRAKRLRVETKAFSGGADSFTQRIEKSKLWIVANSKRATRRESTLDTTTEQQKQLDSQTERFNQFIAKRDRENLIVANIAQCTPVDLIDVQVQASYVDDFKKPKRDNFPIATGLARLITNKEYYQLKLSRADNSHLSSSETAQAFERHMLSNLNKNNAIDVIYDFNNLSIEDYASKYALDCDLSDLIDIYSTKYPEQPKDAQNADTLRFNNDIENTLDINSQFPTSNYDDLSF